MFGKGDFKGAKDIFTSLEGYKDSKKYLEDIGGKVKEGAEDIGNKVKNKVEDSQLYDDITGIIDKFK